MKTGKDIASVHRSRTWIFMMKRRKKFWGESFSVTIILSDHRRFSSMYLRLSRLRLVLLRTGVVLLIGLFLFELQLFFSKERNQFLPMNTNAMERSFWSKLIDEDKVLTAEQRLERIKSISDEKSIAALNWTKMFFDLYQRKIQTLNLRDRTNADKVKQFEDSFPPSQDIFEIYEETPVGIRSGLMLERRLILPFLKVFQRPKFCSSTRIFHPQCPYTNCRWHCQKPPIGLDNRRRARVFHHVDIDAGEMPEKIKTRTSNDIWILWIDEANRQLEHLNDYRFNWTLSFRQDSEVSIGAYGLFIRHEENSSPMHSTNQSDARLSFDLLHMLSSRNLLVADLNLETRLFTNYRYRSKHALWFVSNCEPRRRLDYYEQLKNHFPIQAFGSCIQNDKSSCQKGDACELTHGYSALFYLAFESQTCIDYITEKFWRALSYGMIPIVLGPQKQSYLDLGVPESAFIHVDEFASAKELGDHLHRVSNDYFLYRQYFQWLNDYQTFYQMDDLEPIRMCELCMRLNMQGSREHRFYTNIHRWHRAGCWAREHREEKCRLLFVLE